MLPTILNALKQGELSQDFLDKVKVFKEDWYKVYQDISNENTPKLDGNGKKIVNRRPDGYDYIEESHIRNMLDKHFPGWSWDWVCPLQFLGAEWVVREGILTIIDEHLLHFGIVPSVRRFLGTDAVRIQYRTMPDPKEPKKRIPMPHIPENIVDVGDNCKQANTAALKYAANRLCRIGDDIYGKRTEYDGAGSIETMIDENPNASNFSKWVTEHKGLWSEIHKILNVKDLSEVTDWEDAKNKVKSKKGW